MDNRRVKFCLKILSLFKKIIRKPQGGKIFWRTLYIEPLHILLIESNLS